MLLLAGLAGWATLVVAAQQVHLPPWWQVASGSLFFVVVAGARSLAFVLPGGAEVSLDSAIFIAAALCLGPALTALGVALVVAFDGLRRRRLAFALFRGGVAGALLFACSRIFSVAESDRRVWLAPAFGGAFLVCHYGVQALQEWVAGLPARRALARSGLSVVAEATLLPLAAAIVLIWDPGRPIPFALLGGTYLLVSYGFHRLAGLASALRSRVAELETLNRTAHALGASLETPHLLSALLRETARALPVAEHIDALVELDGQLRRFRVRAGEITVSPAAAGDIAALGAKGPQLQRHRMVVPLVMYGETSGALVAETRDDEGFGENELRLFDAIGGQAAAAVENARLYALANVDGLTGLYVRRYFDVRVAEEVERARRFGTSFALVMLDLDDFKHLNDTYGHLAGDRALREVAALAEGQLRGVDLGARYGGEELSFLLPRTSLADAHAVAERIRQTIEAHDFGGVRITASLGVAGWTEAGVFSPESLVERADQALYRAKAAGKNRVEIDLANFELSPSLAPILRRTH